MKKKQDSLWAIYLIGCISFIILLYCIFRLLQSNGKSLTVDLTDDGQMHLEDRIVIRRKRNGLKKSTNKLWTIYKDKHNEWVVPYELKKGAASEILEDNEKEAILYVMSLIMEKTCLRFMEKEEWRNYETSGGHAAKEWLEIHKDHLGCLTHTGRNKTRPVGKNTIHFKPHCLIRHTHDPNYQKIGRLLLTALGVDLEHRRNDRSTFVTIDKHNIRQAKKNHWYFEKNDPTEFDNYDISYNFLSVMHDRKDNWGKKVKGKQMTVISPNTGYERFENTMGTVEYPSDKDYLLLNRMYECPNKQQQPSPSNNNNYVPSSNNKRPRPRPRPKSRSSNSNRNSNNGGSNSNSQPDNSGGGGGGGNGNTAGVLGAVLGHVHHMLNHKASGSGREKSSSSESNEELKDKAGDCVSKKFLCMDKDYMGMMQVMCKATCKVKGGSIYYKPDCLDVGDHCRHKQPECDHSSTYDAMTLECPHTCGRCEQHRIMMAQPGPGGAMPSSPMMAGYNPYMESIMAGGMMTNPMMAGPGMGGMVGNMGGRADPSAGIPGVMHPQLMQSGMNPMMNPAMAAGTDPLAGIPGVMHPQLMQTGMMGKKKK